MFRRRLTNRSSADNDSDWLPVSDLMAGLMMVFMAVAIFFMLRVQGVAVAYENLQQDLYDDLLAEFEDDLDEWNAVLDRETLSMRFKEPDVLFDVGEATLKAEFKAVLDDFFPRYVSILTSEEYRDHVVELRIEGHTSSEWKPGSSPVDAYFGNMRLSQDRTREVLRYTYTMQAVRPSQPWMKEVLTANGLSSSDVILDSEGRENPAASRRVEFRVVTDAERQMREIYEDLQRLR